MDYEQITIVLNEVVRLELSGQFDVAISKLRPLLGTIKPGPRVVEAYARLSVHFNEQEKALSLINDTLNGFRMESRLESKLHYQAGNLYDNLEAYDDAFYHYKLANDALTVGFDVRAYEPFVDAQKKFFTRKRMTELSRAETDGVVPIFVVGMPRTGTTLTEQILDRHTHVHGAGELNAINDIASSMQNRWSLNLPYPNCLSDLSSENLTVLATQYQTIAGQNAPEVTRVIDKMPSNCGHLGLIELILPSAKIIHCRRHPLDTCLSCYFQNFAGTHQYSRRLEDLALMYRIYLNMVEMWDGVISLPFHELRYEDVVYDQENSSKQLVDFCDLEWEEQCLSFNESKRDVRTCSYNQVRKPMYTKSVNRWENYEKHIAPLLSELDDIIDQYTG